MVIIIIIIISSSSIIALIGRFPLVRKTAVAHAGGRKRNDDLEQMNAYTKHKRATYKSLCYYGSTANTGPGV